MNPDDLANGRSDTDRRTNLSRRDFALFVDGAYVTSSPASHPRFHPAAPLTHEDVARVQRDAMRRIERVLVSRGILMDDPSTNSDDLDKSLLPFVQAASIQSKVALGPESGRPIPRLLDPALAVRSAQSVVPDPDGLTCESAGYSLHAATRIEAEDRDRLERLVRYVARPPLAQGRLEVRGDGKVSPTSASAASRHPARPPPQASFA